MSRDIPSKAEIKMLAMCMLTPDERLRIEVDADDLEDYKNVLTTNEYHKFWSQWMTARNKLKRYMKAILETSVGYY
jgi:hypothetical protein